MKSEEALNSFKANPDEIDLVLTDMTMPRMTGIELAQKIFVIRPDISIILCTGFSETVTEDNAMSFGIKKFLNKPIIIADLAQAIRQALDDKELTN